MSTETAPAGMHLGAGARRSTRSSDVSANRKRKVQDDTDLIRTPVESKRRTVKAYVNKNGSRESNSSGEHDGARKSPPSPNRRKPRTPPKEMRSSDPLSDMIPPNMSPIDDLSIQSPAKEAPNGVNSSLPEAPSTMANLGESQTLAAENNTAETIQREASPVPMTEAIAEQNTPNHTIEAEISPSKSKIAVVAPKASPKGRAKRKAPAHSSSESNARRRTRTSTVPAGAPSPSETRSARQLPFANGGSVINLRSLPTKPASTNLTSGATDEVVGDGPPMNDVMLFDDEIRPTDDQDTIQQKRLVRAAKEEMLKIGEDFSKLYKRRVQLELDAIALEEKQLKAGTHPCFEELEAKYSALDNINLARKRLSREHAQIVCDASIKQANDTFIDRRGDVRRKMINAVNKKKWQLIAEKRKSDEEELLLHDPAPVETHALKRQLELDQLRRSATGIPQYAAKHPEYIKEKLTANRRRGGRIIVPPRLCEGLRKSEIDMDLNLIRAYKQAGSASTIAEQD